ncbi:MAG: carbohydrate kinase family protein [Kiritimatiellaeota bacterium]|nr:carbohydrate kinase family protein [Kiritimatiellota bacterium]
MDVLLLNTAALDIRSADFGFADALVGAGGLAKCETKDMPPYTQEEMAEYIRQGRAVAGGSGNTAPLLARAGLKVAVGATFGGGAYSGLDAQGRAFYDILAKNGVDLSAAKIDPTLPTGTTFIHECPSGERGGMVYFPNANNAFDFEAYKADVLRLAPKVVYYMYSGLSERGDANGGRDLAAFVRWCRDNGALTIVDSHTLTGNPHELIAAGTPVEAYRLLEPILGEVDIFFTSVDEARMIRNTIDPGHSDDTITGFLEFVASRFGGQGRTQLFGVTVKNGAHVVYSQNPEVRFVASRFMVGKVVDLVGAGDSFRAGVVGYIARHAEAFRDGSLAIEDAVQSGNLMATLYVTAPLSDRYGAIPSMESVERVVKSPQRFDSIEALRAALS